MTQPLELPAAVQNRACFQQFIGGLAVDPMSFEQITSTIRAVGMDAVWKANEDAGPGIYSQHVYTIAVGLRSAGVDAKMPAAHAETVDETGTPPYVVANGTAIIPVNGPLSKQPSSLQGMFGGSSTVGMRKALSLALADKDVARIMFHIDSPGGTVAGTGDLGDDIFAASTKKPVAAFIEDMGTSAAYWLASQAPQIYASQYAHIGSIGVIWTVYDRSEQAQKAGIKVHAITSSPGKAFAVDGMKITDKQLAKMQLFVDQMFSQFANAVARGREVDLETARTMAGDADIYDADTAMKLGLVDEITTFGEALAAFSTASIMRSAPADKARKRRARAGKPLYQETTAGSGNGTGGTSSGGGGGAGTVTTWAPNSVGGLVASGSGDPYIALEEASEEEEDAPSNTEVSIEQNKEPRSVTPETKPAGQPAEATLTISAEEHKLLKAQAAQGAKALEIVEEMRKSAAAAEAAALGSERERLCADYPSISKEAAAACSDMSSLRALESVARAHGAKRTGSDPKVGGKPEPSPEEQTDAEIKEWQASHDARFKAAMEV